MNTRHIFIIDDDQSILRSLRRGLELRGYAVATAEHVVELIEDKSLSMKPDLILLDVMMPWMSGFDACYELKKRFDDCPVVMISALDERQDIERGFWSGADDYFTKPFDMDELCARMDELINARSRQ